MDVEASQCDYEWKPNVCMSSSPCMTRHVMTARAWNFGGIVVNICKLEKGSIGYKFCTESI